MMQRASMLMHWLFVDESGRFERPDEDVVVAGVLAPEATRLVDRSTLKRELTRLAPHHPWPLHAHSYACRVVDALAAGLAKEATDLQRQRAAAVRRTLHEHQGVLSRLERALGDGEEPTPDKGEPTLKELDRLLERRAPALSASLADATAATFAAIGRLLDAVCKDESATIVVASETERADAGAGGADRYLVVLDTLIERAAAVVGRLSGRHTVCVVLCQRDVQSRRLPGTMVPMHAVEMRERLSGLARPENVAIAFDSSPRWGPAMHPALVLADFVANRARHCVPRSGTLARIEQATADLVGVAPRREGRSHLAATGLAQQVLHAPQAPWPVAANGPGVRRWAMEQAKEWR